MRRSHLTFLGLVAVLLIPARAVSVALSVELSGTLTAVDNPVGILDASILPGSEFLGNYDVPPPLSTEQILTSRISGPIVLLTDYSLASGPMLSIRIGSLPTAFSFSPTLFDIEEIDSPEGDAYSVVATDQAAFALGSGVVRVETVLTLFDASGDAFSMLMPSLTPPVPAPLALWDSASLVAIGCRGPVPCSASEPLFRIEGTIDSFDVIPEPTTALLLATGLAGMALRRRRLH